MVGVTPSLAAHEDSHASGGTDEIDSVLGVAAIAVHGAAQHTDALITMFVPLNEVESCTKSSKGGFETQDMNSTVARIHGVCIVPNDYVSGGELSLIYIAAGVEKACNSLLDMPCHDEVYSTGGGAGITAIPAGTANDILKVSLAFDFAALVPNDFLGWYVDSDDANNMYAVGFIFEYTRGG